MKLAATTGARCPTKSWERSHEPRESTAAVCRQSLVPPPSPPFFFFSLSPARRRSTMGWYAFIAVRDEPSGDQARRVENVLSRALRKGSSTRATRCQPSMAQTTTLLSSDCEARYLPRGSHTTPFTKELWSSKTATCEARPTLQTRTVLSSEHEATIESSGDQARSVTLFWWPVKVSHLVQCSREAWSPLPKVDA